MKRLLTAVSVFALALAVSSVLPAQSDPRIGTWKLNVAKSKFDPAASRQGETRTYQMSGGAVVAQIETIRGDGSRQNLSFTTNPDGKDYPYKGNPPYFADTISTQPSGKGFTSQSKKGGKLLFTTTSSFSGDGKVMTLTTKGVDADGQSLNSVRIYDKQ